MGQERAGTEVLSKAHGPGRADVTYVGERALQRGYPARVEAHVHEKKTGVHKLACVALANREEG